VTARETAERHARDVVDGTFGGVWKVVEAQRVDA